MTRRAFVLLLFACVADVGTTWLSLHQSLLPPVHGRTVVVSPSHDPSFFSKSPLDISDPTVQSPGPQQHLSSKRILATERQSLHRRTQHDSNQISPMKAEYLQSSGSATTSTPSSEPTLASTTTSSSSTSTATSTSTPDSDSNVISNVLQVPLLPSSPTFTSDGGEGLGAQQDHQQQTAPQPIQPQLPQSQAPHEPPSTTGSSTNQSTSVLASSSLVILSVAIAAVVSLVVLGSAVIVRRRRHKRAKVAGLKCVEGGRRSMGSNAHSSRKSGRGSWTSWFSRQRKDEHYGLHSFNSSGSNTLPEQFWNPE